MSWPCLKVLSRNCCCLRIMSPNSSSDAHHVASLSSPARARKARRATTTVSSLDELGDMIRKQQQLRDKTFKQGQDMRRDRQRQQGGQGQQQLGDLQQDQRGLRDRLNKLLEQLRQRGLGNPGQQQGQDQKGEGGWTRRQRRRSHGRGGRRTRPGRRRRRGRQPGPRARRHAQGRARHGASDPAERHGHGAGRSAGRDGRARAQQDTDPLGRPLRGREYGDDATVKVPGEIDAQRARRILEELRKRFGEAAARS